MNDAEFGIAQLGQTNPRHLGAEPLAGDWFYPKTTIS